jgi:GH24 family phage-related lysozyme (muramidase)
MSSPAFDRDHPEYEQQRGQTPTRKLEQRREYEENYEPKAKTSEQEWTKSFHATTPAGAMKLNLSRFKDGGLEGTYKLQGRSEQPLSGKVLLDDKQGQDDVYLMDSFGAKWHGRFVGDQGERLLFGHITLPGITDGHPVVKLQGVEMGAVEAPIEEASSQPAPAPDVIGTPTVQGPLQPPQQQQQPKPEPKPEPDVKWERHFTVQYNGQPAGLQLEREGNNMTAVFNAPKAGVYFAYQGEYNGADGEFTLSSFGKNSGKGNFISGYLKDSKAGVTLDGFVYVNGEAHAVKALTDGSRSREVKPDTVQPKPPEKSEKPDDKKPSELNDNIERQKGPWEVSDWGIKFLVDHEGVRLKMYNDTANKCTIGIGHKVHDGPVGSNPAEEAPFKNGITIEKATEYLREDVKIAVNNINKSVKVPLDQRTFDVLVSFVFNTGKNAFADSDLVKRLNSGDYNSIPIELRRWTGSKQTNSGKASFDDGLYNRRQAEIENLPPDELDQKMDFKVYQSEYSAKEITKARDLISRLKEPERGRMFLIFQSKISYHNQRDNLSTENSRSIGWKMCNLTSLAMALEAIGIFNPEPKKFPQYEDYLEYLGDTKVKNFDREMPNTQGWPGVANEMGAGVKFIDKPDKNRYQHKREWWEENALPELKSGRSIILSISGHIVRLQDVVLGGLVVDDPNGARIQMSSSGTSFNYGNSADRSHNLNSTNPKDSEANRSKGNDNVWLWDMVEAREMHWVAVLEKKD